MVRALLQFTDLVVADENAAREREHNQDERLECDDGQGWVGRGKLSH